MDNPKDKLFQVSVKGLFFDKDHKLLMVQQEDKMWEPPGGRVQKGEDLLESLRRECLEETGQECEVLEEHPSIVYSTMDQKGRARIMMYYKIRFSNLDFEKTDECRDLKFYTKEEIKNLSMAPQIKRLPEFL